ncbi:hypothetical protein N7456_000133 [Penicillium angulare]|uniref:Major facilitator superfamily (MFS) profile domain-containing protein n=1 Tax=Penicillium angulare TaxID=116970 RepID=A0A9W9GBV1_9EURO|nr:hypothetical protein N7456_000133 [Penicillium angulare]
MGPSSDAAAGTRPPQKATRRMFFFAIWISFAAWLANFDGGFGGIVLIMPSYKSAFGHCQQLLDPETGTKTEECVLSTLQQSLVGVGVLFMAVGSAATGFVGSKFGRKGTIQIGCVISIIGAAGMLGTSGNFVAFVACKSIAGVGLGMLCATAIVYGCECVVPSQRGLLLGLYNIGLALGNLSAAAVCAGSSTLEADNDWQWKTPIICQIPLGILLGAGILMFPESPRWLLLRGEEDRARKSFATFQGLDENSPEVTAQVQEVQQYLEFERAAMKDTSWMEIYRGTNLRRTLVSGMILIGLAITGIQFVATYAALFLSGVGISNTYLINAIVYLCILAGACIGPALIEYGGRRFAMLTGYALMASCMLILSSVSTGVGPENKAAKNVVVAFLCLWAFAFGGFIGPSVWLASAEMHSLRLRTYGQANTTFLYEIFAFGAQFWTPYMLNVNYGNMGSNVGYFYFGITVVVLIFTFFFVPETARLNLEQIDDFFLSGDNAWRTSTKGNIAIARSGLSESSKMVDAEDRGSENQKKDGSPSSEHNEFEDFVVGA